MKAECYIITITTNKESVLAAERCISTSNKFGLPINLWNAYTPVSYTHLTLPTTPYV